MGRVLAGVLVGMCGTRSMGWGLIMGLIGSIMRDGVVIKIGIDIPLEVWVDLTRVSMGGITTTGVESAKVFKAGEFFT